MLAWPVDLPAQYALDGVVRDAATGASLSEAEVAIKGTSARAYTTASGRFHLPAVPAGSVDLVVRRIGYPPRELNGIRVPLAEPVNIALSAVDAVPLVDLFAQASRSTDVTAGLARVLTSEDVRARSFLGEDAYRTLARTPGITADELSARFRMRGAEQEEVLVRLDGLTLVDPFHLNDISGTFSVVDGHWVRQTTVHAAGFGPQYGDRTAGVVEFSTADPVGAKRPSVLMSASLTHLRAASEGVFQGGRGGWLVSARRGVPDLVLPALDGGSRFSPKYLDGMAKVTMSPAADHLVSAHVLVGADRFDAKLDDGAIVSRSHSRRVYSWLRWRAGWQRTLRTETVLSATTIAPERDVAFHPRFPNGVADRRGMTDFAVRHDVDWITNGTFGVRAGTEIHRTSARYDYAFRAPFDLERPGMALTERSDTGSALIEREGTNVAAYLAPRVRLWRLELEAGVRYDYASQTARPRFDPRVRGRLDVSGDMAFLGSWGRYSQAKGLHELDIVGGERSWSLQRATQTTAGVEWRPGGGVRAQAEAYRRIVTEPWSRQVNIELGFEIVPEIDDDNVFVAPPRSRAGGVDIEVEGPLGARARWRTSYSLSRTEDYLEGKWIPRQYDQRHAATVDAAWRVSERWSIAGAWQWHSGWPMAEPNFVDYMTAGGRVVPGYDYLQLGVSRLPAYNRFDVRIRHDLPVAGGTLGVSLDLVNVLNRKNVRGISYDGVLRHDGSVAVQRSPLTMAPRVPSLALSWTR